jgi:hypothetical protein
LILLTLQIESPVWLRLQDGGVSDPSLISVSGTPFNLPAIKWIWQVRCSIIGQIITTKSPGSSGP